jgi:membrane protein implicated in regulation of membrane protease activity
VKIGQIRAPSRSDGRCYFFFEAFFLAGAFFLAFELLVAFFFAGMGTSYWLLERLVPSVLRRESPHPPLNHAGTILLSMRGRQVSTTVLENFF